MNARKDPSGANEKQGSLFPAHSLPNSSADFPNDSPYSLPVDSALVTPESDVSADTSVATDAAAESRQSYRVLHTADWHLGKTLSDESRHDEHQHFLDWLLETILSEKIDAVIVAGDIFDSARPPQRAVKQYYSFLANLYQGTCGECRIVLTAGNHDSPAHLDAPQDVLQTLNAKVVGELPQDIGDTVCALPDAENPEVLVAALPFLRDRDLRSGRLGQSAAEIEHALRAGIRDRYQQAASACDAAESKNPSWTRVGRIAVGHLTVKGASNSDSERDIHIGGLGSVGHDIFPESFDYVALGHLHRPQKAESSGRVCYSGSPIPLSFSEANDEKSVRILDFESGKLVQNEVLLIPARRQLVQLKTTRNDLESTLTEVELPTSDLETWVELIIETSDVNEDVATLAHELAEDKPFRLVCVRRERVGEAPALQNSTVSPEEIDDLLADPKSVFDQLLDQHVDLTDQDRDSLRTAFDELCETHSQRETSEELDSIEASETVAASDVDEKAVVEVSSEQPIPTGSAGGDA